MNVTINFTEAELNNLVNAYASYLASNGAFATSEMYGKLITAQSMHRTAVAIQKTMQETA